CEGSGSKRGVTGRLVWSRGLGSHIEPVSGASAVPERFVLREAGAGARAAGSFSDSAPRQLEDERRPFTRRADDLQIAAHSPSEIAADREAQAGAVRAAGERSAELDEGL